MRYFVGADVVRATGVNQKVLTQWIDRHLVLPSVKAQGRGAKHEFTLVDIIRIGLLDKLAGMGIPRETAGAIAFCPMGTNIGRDLFARIEGVVTSYKAEIEARRGGTTSILGSAVFAWQVYLACTPRSDVPGYVAIGHHIGARQDFAALYETLENEDGAVLVNLTKVVKRVMDVLGG